ncbi:MAG TPA: OmpH family outer membrane protein [Bacteroidia bacterium]|jgi:outer membrane protein|nr:OmpH family outer membrane protein [Bacteroidia bacterium]
MKNFSIALNAILLVLVIILFVMFNNLKKGMGQDGSSSSTGMMTGKNKLLRIAYINADTINGSYLLMKDFKAEITAKQMEMQDEYNKKAKKLQDEYEAYMKQKQAGNISELDAQKEEQDMQGKKNEIDALQQQQQDLMKDVQDRNIEIQKTVQRFIAGYNKTAHLDYVFTYESVGGSILFANDSLDITKAIVGGLNQQYKDSIQKASSGAAGAKH